MCCNIQVANWTEEDDSECWETNSAETSRALSGNGSDSEEVDVVDEATSRSVAIPGPSKPRASATNQKARKRTRKGRKAARMKAGQRGRGDNKTKKLSMNEMKNEDHPGLVINAAGEKLYNVERILKKQVARGVVWYRVKWEGWDKSKNTWERAENLTNCSVVNDFELNEYRKKLAKLARRKKGKKTKARCSSKRTSPPNPPAASNRSEPQLPFVSEANDPVLSIGERNEIAEALELEQEVNYIMDGTYTSRFEFTGEEGMLFRREWNHNEVPVSAVGSTIVDGTVLYLVRIRNHEADDPVGDPMDFSNCVMALPSIVLRHFPQILMGYYENRLGPNGLGQPVIAAAKKEILRRCAMMQ